MEDPDEFEENRIFYRKDLHPYNDGCSSHRVLKAIDEVILSEEWRQLSKRVPAFGLQRKLKRLVQ